MRWAVLPALSLVTALPACTSSLSPAFQSGTQETTAARATAPPATSASPRRGACRSEYTPSVLPTWAQTGFRPPTHPMPHVIGDHGNIAAILWVNHEPLVVPPAADRNNKILWAARTPGAPLQIRATLAGTGQTATRTVPNGPGPSSIDLPAAGCWSFDLTWGDSHDHLQLEYVAG
jgi:hypothetical protein